METSEIKDSSRCVRVAVNIRPLVTSELALGCSDCVKVLAGEPQVQIGSHRFMFDYVYGCSGHHSSLIYEECVAPLVDALCDGYNSTVLAYGQTGSGKTYTMGTNYEGEGNNGGIIPKVMEMIFSRVDAAKQSTESLMTVSFVEIFKEEIYDLLDPYPAAYSRDDDVPLAKTSGPARVPIQIRETTDGGITLAGVTEEEVRSKEEMASFLLRGSLRRATGITNMNRRSSRSHAIFTISMEQKRFSSLPNGSMHDGMLHAKLQLVDLAGSESAKRTGADALRLQEGIHINKGLLALGNVIRALGDEKKRKEGGHVPYRDSKLTRLLQDCLGGNSKTVMIACVSPADRNAEETLNTLKYANRARNIQNKSIVNREQVAAQMRTRQTEIEQFPAELVYFRGDSATLFEELQILKHKISLIEASNTELKKELREQRISCEHPSERAIDVQVIQRTEEAAMATKRLKELLESLKTSSCGAYADGNNNGPGIQALMHAIEHEIEVTKLVHEVRSEYERLREETAEMVKEVIELKKEAGNLKQCIVSDCRRTSPGATRENILSMTSSTLVSMASQLSEAEERERAFNGRGRWNQVRSLAEAKTVINFLFNLASSTRCSLWDKELSCREKNSEIRILKEKLANLIGQLEMQEAELLHQKELLKSAAKKTLKVKQRNSEDSIQSNEEAPVYDLRLKGARKIVSASLSNSSSDAENTKMVPALDRNTVSQKTASEVCCSCSRKSSCKTVKCKCQASRVICNASCRCRLDRCSNRVVFIKNIASTDERESSCRFASHGAMLLQAALSKNRAETKNYTAARKPLSDIGNTIDHMKL